MSEQLNTQTFGQKAVGISNDVSVTTCNQKFADLIDQLYDFSNLHTTCQVAKRHALTAINTLEDAQARAVKALTWKE